MNLEDKKKEWSETLKSAYNSTDSLSKEIKTLLEIIIYVSFGEKIGRLYKIINDNDLFSKIIEEFGNNEIEFPSKEDFTESIMTAIVYYYKEILGYNWEQIEKLLPYNRRIDKLGDKIKKRLKQIERDNKTQVEEESLFKI